MKVSMKDISYFEGGKISMEEKKDKFAGYPEISNEKIDAALRFSCGQVERNLPRFTERFQNAYSVNNFYEPIDNTDWTNGFWTGEIWLSYE